VAAVQRLLAAVPLQGQLVTGDALYCQRAFCAQVLAAGGDYLLTVKGNQPALAKAITRLLAQPTLRLSVDTQRDRHGDRYEVRRLVAASTWATPLDWPGVQQVFSVTRTVQRKGKTSRQQRLGMTSLPEERADAAGVLGTRRGHWRIENRLHWVRDVSLGEDACQVRSGAAPQVMAALRNLLLNLLRLEQVTNVAAALRRYAWQPGTALQLLGIGTP
jgi:predicted transposase YbfD/YdcC